MVASFDELGARLKGLENKGIVDGGKKADEKVLQRPQPVKRSTWTTSTSPEKTKVDTSTLLEAPRTILGDKNSSTTPRQRTQSDITGTGIGERAARLLSSASNSISTSPDKSSFDTPRAIKRSTWTIPSTSSASTTPVIKDIKLTSSSPLYPQSITTPATAGLRSTQRDKLDPTSKTPFNTPTNQQQSEQPSWFTPKLRPAHARTQSLPLSPIFVQQVAMPSTTTPSNSTSPFTNPSQQKYCSRPTSPSKSNTSRPASPLKSHWTTKDLEKEKETTPSQIQPRSNSPSKRGPLPTIPPTPNNTPITSKTSTEPQSKSTSISTYTTPSWSKPRLSHSRSQSLPPPPMIQLPPGAPRVRNNLPDTPSIYTPKSKVEEKEIVRTPSLVDKSSASGSIRPKSIHVALKSDITVTPRTQPTAYGPLTKSSTPAAAQKPIETKKEEEGEETCATCLKDLGYGEFVQLAHTGAIIHRDCFRCGGCSEILEAGSHVEIEGKAWHSDCAPKKVIKSLVKAGGEEVVVGGDRGEEEKCEKCKGDLNSKDYSISVAKTGKSYHQDCFTCGGCRKAFAAEGDQRSFVDVAGVPYHPTVSFSFFSLYFLQRC